MFSITTIIIPKQNATSDTCAMHSEEEIVECQDKEDVLTLGWIHVHFEDALTKYRHTPPSRAFCLL